MQNNNDTALIAQILDGDQQLFAVLVDRYKNSTYYHCFAIVRDGDVAEDMAQETFIRAYYKLKSYKPEYKFSTWLFKIATNRCLSYLKKQKRREVFDGNQRILRAQSNLPGPEKVQFTASYIWLWAGLAQNIVPQ